MLNPGELVGGRYKVIKLLGMGGYGATYLASDVELPNHPSCVVKQLQPRFSNPVLLQDARQRFAQEASVLQRLGNHPQIPQLLAHFQENEEFFLVQEYVDGEELKKEVERSPLNEIEVIKMLKDILEILDFVHQQQVIHRDIKPPNLIRRRSDRKMVLIDFGAVKEITTMSAGAEQQSMYTQAIGTPGYLPPEQQQGKPSFSSDIYALGRTAVYALTKMSLIELEDTQTGKLKKWQEIAHVSDRFRMVIDKMVEPRLGDRYANCNQVLQDIEPLLKLYSVVGSRYKIVDYLGGSPWSLTYRAENLDKQDKVPFIIKQLKSYLGDSRVKKKALERFESELKALETLGVHPQIPQLIEKFEENGDLYLVQEYVLGETLSTVIENQSTLPEQEVIELLKDVLEVLDYIHQQGVIHRDIKPSNLIIRAEDHKMVVIDFGIVKEILTSNNSNTKNYTITQPLGTSGYVPPEQMAGRPTYNSDIYALGITAIQALTGLSPEEIQKDRQTGEIDWSKNGKTISPALSKIIDKMVRLELGKRYQSARQVSRDLNRIKLAQSPIKKWLWKYGLPLSALVLAIFFGRFFWLQYNAILAFTQADISLENKDYKKALEFYDEGLEYNKRFERAWLGKASVLSHLKRYQDMLEVCREAAEYNKNNPYILNCQGTALFGLQRYEEAVAAYEKALIEDPQSFEIWNNLGEAHLKLKQISKAIQDFQRAISISPEKSFVAWTNLGKLYFEIQDYPRAIEAYQKGINVRNDYLAAWLGIGNVYTVQKEYAKSLDSYTKATQVDNTSAEAWYKKGLTESLLKRNTDAIFSLRRALEQNPKYQPAINALQKLDKGS